MRRTGQKRRRTGQRGGESGIINDRAFEEGFDKIYRITGIGLRAFDMA
jgi:hypothetical protein